MVAPNATTVEIKAVITALNANFNYKTQPERWDFPQAGQPPRTSIARPKMEIDTENVRVSFMIDDHKELKTEEINSISGAIPMKRDDVKRLNVTVGDTIVLHVGKE